MKPARIVNPARTESPPRLRLHRERAGWSQQALAERIGLTRQAVSDIEAGRYVPNTAVALRLATQLATTVEALFADETPAAPLQVEWLERPPATGRAQVARVRDRWLGLPLDSGRDRAEGFAPADALITRSGGRTGALPLAPGDALDQTALLIGCDPGLGLLRAHVERHDPKARLLWRSAASRAALQALAAGRAHAAGIHLSRRDGAGDNLEAARKALAATGGVVVAFARWEEGLMVAPGNPLKIRTVADLARRSIRLLNREPGAGSRASLDEWLDEAGISASRVKGYGSAVHGPLNAARGVAEGLADAAVGSRAAAASYGLDFIPVDFVNFDLVIPADLLAHPTLVRLLEVCQGRALREELSRLPGYEVAQLGRIIARIPKSRKSSASAS